MSFNVYYCFSDAPCRLVFPTMLDISDRYVITIQTIVLGQNPSLSRVSTESIPDQIIRVFFSFFRIPVSVDGGWMWNRKDESSPPRSLRILVIVCVWRLVAVQGRENWYAGRCEVLCSDLGRRLTVLRTVSPPLYLSAAAAAKRWVDAYTIASIPYAIPCLVR